MEQKTDEGIYSSFASRRTLIRNAADLAEESYKWESYKGQTRLFQSQTSLFTGSLIENDKTNTRLVLFHKNNKEVFVAVKGSEFYKLDELFHAFDTNHVISNLTNMNFERLHDGGCDAILDMSCAFKRFEEGCGFVHVGFYVAAKSVINDLTAALSDLVSQGIIDPDYHLVLTGHSLGGAIATVLSAMLPIKTYLITFASPHVGNQEFAEYHNKHCHLSLRFALPLDLVPKLLTYRSISSMAVYVSRMSLFCGSLGVDSSTGDAELEYVHVNEAVTLPTNWNHCSIDTLEKMSSFILCLQQSEMKFDDLSHLTSQFGSDVFCFHGIAAYKREIFGSCLDSVCVETARRMELLASSVIVGAPESVVDLNLIYRMIKSVNLAINDNKWKCKLMNEVRTAIVELNKNLPNQIELQRHESYAEIERIHKIILASHPNYQPSNDGMDLEIVDIMSQDPAKSFSDVKLYFNNLCHLVEKSLNQVEESDCLITINLLLVAFQFYLAMLQKLVANEDNFSDFDFTDTVEGSYEKLLGLMGRTIVCSRKFSSETVLESLNLLQSKFLSVFFMNKNISKLMATNLLSCDIRQYELSLGLDCNNLLGNIICINHQSPVLPSLSKFNQIAAFLASSTQDLNSMTTCQLEVILSILREIWNNLAELSQEDKSQMREIVSQIGVLIGNDLMRSDDSRTCSLASICSFFIQISSDCFSLVPTTSNGMKFLTLVCQMIEESLEYRPGYGIVFSNADLSSMWDDLLIVLLYHVENGQNFYRLICSLPTSRIISLRDGIPTQLVYNTEILARQMLVRLLKKTRGEELWNKDTDFQIDKPLGEWKCKGSYGQQRVQVDETGLPVKIFLYGMNMIGALPEEISGFDNVQELSVSYNGITSIPDSILNMSHLRKLWIIGNPITESQQNRYAIQSKFQKISLQVIVLNDWMG